MDDTQEPVKSPHLSLSDVIENEEEVGDDETVWYTLRYLQEDNVVDHKGKVYEISPFDECPHEDLKPLANKGYTHYGIFRLKDRSTSTFAQDEDGNVYRVFSFSMGDAKISYEVQIILNS